MIRYKMSILLFLFSTLLLTTFAFDAQAQDNPEVQKILAHTLTKCPEKIGRTSKKV